MSKSKHPSQPFILKGQFVEFIIKDGYKIKGLRLLTQTGEQSIKLSKIARASCPTRLTYGLWLQIWGVQKGDEADRCYKAERILVMPAPPQSPSSEELRRPMLEAGKSANFQKARILVCKKSDCCKRGGTAVTEALEQALRDRQLTDKVSIQFTGCMKQCKAGPNIVMPDKTRYCRISAHEVPQIIDRHFQSQPSNPQPDVDAVPPRQVCVIS